VVYAVIGVLSIIVTGITWGEAVFGLSGVGWSISFEETSEVANMDQFFDFVLKCHALIYVMAVVLVIFAILGHIGIGEFKVLRGGGMRSAWRASSRSRDLGTFSGAYMENRGGIGSLGLDLEHEGGLSVLMAEGV